MELCYLPPGMLQRVAKNTWAHNEKYPKALSASSFFRVQGQGHSVCLPFVSVLSILRSRCLLLSLVAFVGKLVLGFRVVKTETGVNAEGLLTLGAFKGRFASWAAFLDIVSRKQFPFSRSAHDTCSADVLFLAYGANFTREMLAFKRRRLSIVFGKRPGQVSEDGTTPTDVISSSTYCRRNAFCFSGC